MNVDLCEIDSPSQEFWADNEDDFMLYNAAEHAESQEFDFAMTREDNDEFCEANEKGTNADSDQSIEPDLVMKSFMEEKDDGYLYQVAESLDTRLNYDNYSEESLINFFETSQNDPLLYGALDGLEEAGCYNEEGP